MQNFTIVSDPLALGVLVPLPVIQSNTDLSTKYQGTTMKFADVIEVSHQLNFWEIFWLNHKLSKTSFHSLVRKKKKKPGRYTAAGQQKAIPRVVKWLWGPQEGDCGCLQELGEASRKELGGNGNLSPATTRN